MYNQQGFLSILLAVLHYICGHMVVPENNSTTISSYTLPLISVMWVSRFTWTLLAHLFWEAICGCVAIECKVSYDGTGIVLQNKWFQRLRTVCSKYPVSLRCDCKQWLAPKSFGGRHILWSVSRSGLMRIQYIQHYITFCNMGHEFYWALLQGGSNFRYGIGECWGNVLPRDDYQPLAGIYSWRVGRRDAAAWGAIVTHDFLFVWWSNRILDSPEGFFFFWNT